MDVTSKEISSQARLRPKIVLALAAGCALLLVIFFMNWNASKVNTGNAMAQAPAPDFALTLFDSSHLTLSDLRGKPFVLNFWASWCPPCRDEAPAMERVWQKYEEKGVLFLGIDVQDREEDARAFIRDIGITYPNGPDRDNEIATRYRLGTIPTSVFINSDGKIVRRWVGPVTEAQLTAFIEEMIK